MADASKILGALAAGQRTQKLEDVFDRFYQRCGGPQAFADLLYEEFQAAAPGSLTRQRILDVVLKTTKALDDKAAASSDLDGMSEDDLVREFGSLLASQGVQLGTPHNGPPAVGNAAPPAAGVPAPGAGPAPPGAVPGGGRPAP